LFEGWLVALCWKIFGRMWNGPSILCGNCCESLFFTNAVPKEFNHSKEILVGLFSSVSMAGTGLSS